MANKKNQTPFSAGCCLLAILYIPVGIILDLAKKYNKPRRGRRR